MNVIYWGEPDSIDTDDDSDLGYEPEQPRAGDRGLELQLQLVSDTVDSRYADDEAFVSRWLAESQFSGL